MGGVGPSAESCNGRDDDCDGAVDEGDPGGGAACGSDVGACTSGTLRCSGGALTCQGATLGTFESCNGMDDDCDGATDEGYALASDPRNCGACGNACALPNAIPGCTSGACTLLGCLTGFHDRDGLSANGCEYACDVAGAEVCNGRDDDCDGRVDEALTPPAFFCNPNGVCAGTAATCGGASGWQCSYPASYQIDETRCDALDNDCDGRVDESHPLVGTACTNGELGACRRTGTYVCSSGGASVTCTAPASGGGSAEACNGVDDDCDGALDESAPASWVRFTGSFGTRWIMAYEASRPDATSSSAGSLSHRVCSAAGRLPWTNLTYTEAQAACATVGGRLCTEAEWQRACEASSGSCDWSFASSCTSYPPNATTCNGNDHDPSSASGDQDVLLTAGALSMCYADWGGAGRVFDLSGNAEEWTQARSSGVNPVRGGSYNDTSGGMRCDFDFVVANDTFRVPNVGFRCCRSTAP
ncbi:MAG: MopE-related protein [Sandaracinaceae bacterium]|nr:MopE-related protein [Sandaracinaceae bacterium]